MLKLQGLFFDCVISGAESAGFSVAEFELDEAYSSLYTLTLKLVSSRANVDINALLLKKATFSVFVNGVPKRHVEGIVTRANVGKTGFHRTFYTIVIRPRLWLMTQRQNSRIFHHKTIPDVLSQLMGEHQVSPKMTMTQKHSSREYITQKRETDYAFFKRLAAEEGIVFWSFYDGSEKLVLSDKHVHLRGGIPIEFNPHPQSNTVSNVIHDLSLSVSMTPQKVIGKDRMYENPAYDFQHSAISKTLDVDPDYYAFFDSYARFPNDEMGDQIADWRLKALQNESEMGDAKSNCVELAPGYAFLLSSHPNDKLNTSWQVIEAHHYGAVPQVLEEDADDKPAKLTNTLKFISSNKEWHAPFKHKPIVDGPEVAEVVGPPGEEIFTNEFGAVKIAFHWNRYDKKDDRASCWVRVAQGWSGHDYGFYAIPRIGQEVIVSYLDGDIDRPLITGCVYNGNMNRPIDMMNNKTQMVLRSKSHKGEGFNELRFDDDQGKENFSMHAQYNMNTTVLNDRATQVNNDHSEIIEANQSISIGSNQTISIGGDQSMTIGNNQSINVAAQHETNVGNGQAIFTMDNAGNITLSANTEIKLKVGENYLSITADSIKNIAGNGNITTEAESGNVYLKGSVLTQVGNGTDTAVLANDNLQVKGTTLVDIKGAIVKVNS